MKHIGIVDITTVGACICANEIVTEYTRINKTEMHPEFTLHAFPFALYKEYILSQDWVGLSNVILSSNEMNLLKPVVDTTRFIAHKAIEFAQS